ncbi:MAG: DUF4143 domain-containing protein [Nitrospiraceae bacterium]|nr:DUF4143 domain-containing protein [Nitrospiraceae bacterium]
MLYETNQRNLAFLSNDTGVSTTTVKNCLSVLKASYILFELPPWFENVGKRLVRSSKLYFVDTGLASFLLGLQTEDQVKRESSGEVCMKTWWSEKS